MQPRPRIKVCARAVFTRKGTDGSDDAWRWRPPAPSMYVLSTAAAAQVMPHMHAFPARAPSAGSRRASAHACIVQPDAAWPRGRWMTHTGTRPGGRCGLGGETKRGRREGPRAREMDVFFDRDVRSPSCLLDRLLGRLPRPYKLPAPFRRSSSPRHPAVLLLCTSSPPPHSTIRSSTAASSTSPPTRPIHALHVSETLPHDLQDDTLDDALPAAPLGPSLTLSHPLVLVLRL